MRTQTKQHIYIVNDEDEAIFSLTFRFKEVTHNRKEFKTRDFVNCLEKPLSAKQLSNFFNLQKPESLSIYIFMPQGLQTRMQITISYQFPSLKFAAFLN
ncbi:hypothetical protein ACFLQ1_02410 [Candidatus Auribacterota bacterium]